ncbi:hypothetical protein [Streptomyces sp. GQFP]|uniref:hypothetical protein n=1 Tax=Streptomyces sp. GQFP TaxID=2907545 RepID=UPI001F4691DD|nr:hypothetical protein [Streptomyces sp. GQFP]UIX29100.1 hypothetical protein LUX31_03170 [Streptomyces sp. GQFP]
MTGKRFDQVLTEHDARAAARFMDTMVEAKPAALCRAFGRSRERAATALGS